MTSSIPHCISEGYKSQSIFTSQHTITRVSCLHCRVPNNKSFTLAYTAESQTMHKGMETERNNMLISLQYCDFTVTFLLYTLSNKYLKIISKHRKKNHECGGQAFL